MVRISINSAKRLLKSLNLTKSYDKKGKAVLKKSSGKKDKNNTLKTSETLKHKGKNVFTIGLLAVILFGQTSLYAVYGVVVKATDGDTIALRSGGKKVVCRVAYIDTPEKRKNRKYKRDISRCAYLAREEMVKAGKLATEYAKKQLPRGSKIKFFTVDKDRYGRAICKIYTPKGELYNYKAVADGYAVPYYRYITNRHKRTRFDSTVTRAKREKLGLWKVTPRAMECLLNDRKRDEL